MLMLDPHHQTWSYAVVEIPCGGHHQLATLSEPPFDSDGGGCWHIYTGRRSQENEEVPYTLETFDRYRSAWSLKIYLATAAIGAVATGLLSAFVYLCGLIVGWIYQGFRRA